MDLSFLKFPIRDLDKIESLQQLRERLLTFLLHSAFVLATVLYVISLIPAYQKGLTIPPLVYTVLYIWLAVVAFRKHIPYSIRAGSWAIFFYLLGVDNLGFSGLNVDSGLFFLSYVLMTALFFDLKRGMLALGISAISIELFGYAIVNGHLNPGLALPQTASFLWIIGGLIFVMAGMLLILPLSVLMRGLVGYLEKAKGESEELKDSNQALRSSEERYRSLVEISPDLITLINLDGKSVLINEPGFALFGYHPGDLVGDDYLMFIAPADRPRIAEAFQQTLEVGSARDVACQCIRKDGTLFDAEFSTSLIRKENGEPEAVIAVGRDITARRMAEQMLQDAKERLERAVLERTAELRSANERLKELVSNSPTVIYASGITDDYPVEFVSENVQDLLGYTPDQFVNDPFFWHSRIHPEDVSSVLAGFTRMLETGETTVEYRFCHKSGEYRWMRDSARLVRSPDGQPVEMVGSWTDVTAQKQAEESYQTLVENSKQGIAVYQEGRIVYGNREIAKSFGIELEELESLTPEQIVDFIHPDDRALIWNKYQSRLAGNFDFENYEIRLQLNGKIRYLTASSVPIIFAGKPALQISTIDLTERKKMEQALREAEASYKTLVENSIQGILVFQDNRIVYYNRALADSFGVELGELESFSPEQGYELVHPDDRAGVISRFQASTVSGYYSGYYEIRILQRNGEIRYLDVSTMPIVYDGKPALQVATIDLTERKKMEHALAESEETARVILNATQDSLLLLDLDEIPLSVNQIAAERMGKQPGELIGVSLRDLYPEEIARTRSVRFASVVENGKHINFEDINKDVVFDVNLFPVFDDHGQVKQVVMSARDVTEHKKMEKALRESEETARAMMNATPSSLALIDSNGVVLAANTIAARGAGMGLEELPGKNVHQILPDDLDSTRKDRLDRVFKTGEPVQFDDFRRGRWLDMHIHPIHDDKGQVTRAVVSAIDLTERKKMEQALRESEETLRAMIDATPASLTMLDSDGRYLAANEIAAKRLGVELEDMLGKTAYQFFPEEVARTRKTYVESVFQTGRHVTFEDFRGEYCFENHIYPVTSSDGQVTRVVVSSREITERKQMEQALRESEESLRIMMNTTPSALGMMDADARLLAANKSLADRMGMNVEEMLGKDIYQLLPEELARSRKVYIDDVFRTGQSVRFEDFRQGIWFENHIYPILNESGRVTRVVFSAIDLTERMRIEQALLGTKEELEARVAERTWELLENRERLRVLTMDVVNAQEEERRRISRELHDEAGQALVSMKYSLESILADLPGKNLPIRERLTAAIQQLDQTMDEIRFLAHSLRPPLLDIADLDLTLRDYCREFSESTKLQVEYTGEPIPRLTDLAELAFFRFLQEALTNVVKHARATRAQVRLKTRGRYLSLIVLDDGVGRKPGTKEGQGHLGIRERFRILNGQVRIRSSSETGFIISTRIPYLVELEDDEQGN